MFLKQKFEVLLQGKRLTSSMWNKGSFLRMSETGVLIFGYVDSTEKFSESVLKAPHFLELIAKTDGVLDEN